MRIVVKKALVFLLFFPSFILSACGQGANGAIYSGVPWFDNRGNIVSAHGGCIVKDNGRYYLFGERHTDTSNAFAGFNCYSSRDLRHCRFEGLALTVQPSGRLGPSRVGERVKVMKCPATGEYVMYMHTDNLGYRDPCIGYATSRTITGPYIFRGPLLFKERPIRKWDMGTFQDRDGSGYLLIHGGNIYQLSEDYQSIREQVCKNMTSGFESPALFRKDSLYYFLGSHLTSWERNDNYYYTATSLKGPWTYRGTLAPSGTLTWNSQTTFVFPIEGSEDTTFMFMGDRWSFPRQASAATYVWRPLVVSGTSVAMPAYRQGWKINCRTGRTAPASIRGKTIDNTDNRTIAYTGDWRRETPTGVTASVSGKKGASVSLGFRGRRIAFYGLAGSAGGYAKISLAGYDGKAILQAIVDLYCKYPAPQLKFLSPVLPRGRYTMTVSVMGEHSHWSDKRKNDYGSTGNFVAFDKVVVMK